MALLGAKAITSLEDDAPEAKVMKQFYYPARDGLLEEQEWSFATRLFQPAKSATAPSWGWGSAFPVPSDIIRVLRVDKNQGAVPGSIEGDMRRDQVPHEVYNREILCNEDIIFCSGVRRVEDEGIYSPLFFEAFATKLALLAALPITESNQKWKEMAVMHATTLKTAKSRDGQQSTTRRLRSHWLRRVR